jgi:hypothetical protein
MSNAAPTPEPRRGTWADFVEHAGGGATYIIYVDGVEHTRGYRTSYADARKDAREDLQIARMFCGRAGKRED